MEGWIKLHRKILDSKFGCNLEMSGLFDRLLLMANYKEGFTVDGTKIFPGQFMTSQELLAKKFSVDRGKMRRMLNKLENAQQIAQQTSAKNTIITIVNWHLYQGDEQVIEHQTNSSRTTDEHQVNTNKKANKANKANKEKKNTGDDDKKNLASGEPIIFHNPKDPRFTPDHVLDLWNGDLGKTNGYVSSLGARKHTENCWEAIQFLPDESAWKNLFSITKSSEFLMGNNNRKWKARLFWLVDYDNAARVLAGEFDNGADENDLYSKIREQSA